LAVKGNGSALPGKADGSYVTTGVTCAGVLACVCMNKGVNQLGMALARLSRKVALSREDRVRRGEVGRHGGEYLGVHTGVLAHSRACLHRFGQENRDLARRWCAWA
jgi:hypothetical protein